MSSIEDDSIGDGKVESKNLVEVVYKPTVTASRNGHRDSILKVEEKKEKTETACWFLHWAAITGAKYYFLVDKFYVVEAEIAPIFYFGNFALTFFFDWGYSIIYRI